MPLYLDIETAMLKRISDGDWPPGTRLPNEFVLADEFGVSQGTMRKALSGLLARGLLHRRPKHGTVVAEQTDETALFAFFRLRDAEGAALVPEPGTETLLYRDATRSEAELLETKEVWEITRVRLHDGTPFSEERIILPESRCPGLDAHLPLANSLYPFLEQTYRLTVERIEEDLSAIVAPEKTAMALRIRRGAAVLRTIRRSYDLTGACVECRDSLYLTDERHYAVQLHR